MSKTRTRGASARRPSVIVKVRVPRDLNHLVPSVVHEPRIRIHQDRYRHRRIPLAVKRSRGVVRHIRVIRRRSPHYFIPSISLFSPRSGYLVQQSFTGVQRRLKNELHRRRYQEVKNRRARVSDGHLASLRTDRGLLSLNAQSVESLSDAALVQRAVFGD